MRVITLGTSAGRPTLYRSASAVALEYEGDVFLFDCGEGAQLRMIESPLRWGNLHSIFITHLHGDHLNGLPGLLATLSFSERVAPLKLFGPPGIKKYLQLLREIRSMWIRFPVEVVEIQSPGILLEDKKFQVETQPLNHVIECWGFVFREKPRAGRFDEKKAEALGIPIGPLRGQLVQGKTIQLPDGKIVEPNEVVGPPRKGRSVAYCLDTRPCEGDLRLAFEADLVIHEATFDESMKQEIETWGHSTAKQAAQIAKQANAKRLLLTHISPRYFEGKELLREARSQFKESEIAYDLSEWKIEVEE